MKLEVFSFVLSFQFCVVFSNDDLEEDHDHQYEAIPGLDTNHNHHDQGKRDI